ncbi:MAG: MYXO-CTERM sorting domain-containing protein [Polyangiaceae bacterium]|nr:MYXO-CTERM sorting domain-containing protein [Polyangiaceae bacterium]
MGGSGGSGGGSAGGSTTDAEDDGGCGCRSARRDASSAAWLALGALGVLARRRRQS